MGTCITKYNVCQNSLDFKSINFGINNGLNFQDLLAIKHNRIFDNLVEDYKKRLEKLYTIENSSIFKRDPHYLNIKKIIEIHKKNTLQKIVKIQIFYKKHFTKIRNARDFLKEEKLNGKSIFLNTKIFNF